MHSRCKRRNVAAHSVLAALAALELSHGRRPWTAVRAMMSRVAAKESFAATRLMLRRISIHGLQPWLGSEAAAAAKTDARLAQYTWNRGAMTKLISDSARVEISNKVQDILRNLMISDCQSKPHQQHQNPAEHRYQVVKWLTNNLLDCSGAPESL